MPKSLKNEPNIKQIKNDVLLGIASQPDNTCPLIDVVLTRERARSHGTRITNIEFGNDADDYTVDLTVLFKRGKELTEWSENVIELFEEYVNPPKNKDEQDEYDDQLNTIKEIKEHIKNNVEHILENYAEKINKHVEEWSTLNENFFDLEKDKLDLEFAKENAERMLDEVEDEDEEYNVQIEIDNYTNDLNRNEKDFDNLKRDFRYMEIALENDCENFDQNLEIFRTHNDAMRKLTASVKSYFLDHNQEFDITQPMTYLKKLEKGNNTEISLGILDNDLTKITDYLFKNNIIDDIQKSVLNKLKDKNKLIDTLKNEGYTSIRYYNNENDFLKDKNNFNEIKIEEKRKQRLSI